MRKKVICILAVGLLLLAGCGDDYWPEDGSSITKVSIVSPAMDDAGTLTIVRGEPVTVQLEVLGSTGRPYAARTLQGLNAVWSVSDETAAVVENNVDFVLVTGQRDLFDGTDPVARHEPITSLTVSFSEMGTKFSKTVPVQVVVNLKGGWLYDDGAIRGTLTLRQEGRHLYTSGNTYADGTADGTVDGDMVQLNWGRAAFGAGTLAPTRGVITGYDWTATKL